MAKLFGFGGRCGNGILRCLRIDTVLGEAGQGVYLRVRIE